MVITSLRLSDFRQYASLQLELQPGLSVFEGPNAQGKTTLLEAIAALALGRSFRSSSDADLLRWGTSAARCEGVLLRSSGRRRELGIRWFKQGQRLNKQVLRQGQPVDKLADFLGELPLSMFTPDDLQLVQGAPSERRRYLDQILCKLYPAYLDALSRYQKVVRARTRLLRTPSVSPAEFEPWEEMMVSCGSQLVVFRAEACERLGLGLRDVHAHMAPHEVALELRYKPATPEDFADALQRARRQELKRGACLVGPHRDDFSLMLGELDLRRFGSQGQRRTAALSLRLAQARFFEEVGGEPAVVLLDDCLSELDPSRQSGLLLLLANTPQVLITTATPLALEAPCRLYRVGGGCVESV